MRHPTHTRDHLVMGDGTVDDAREWIGSADRLLIAAGAGLSAAAGFDYGDHTRFAELFPALHHAGFRARYELIGYPLPPRHQWGFWAVHVDDIRLQPVESSSYAALRTLAGSREHYVMSSNVDALFTRHGFASDRVYTPQGDYALYQCLTPCTRQVWDARPILSRALHEYDPATGQTSEEAVPVCPNCGGPVYLNVNGGSWYINDHFQPQREGLEEWLADGLAQGKSTTILEIGAGFNTPGVIRFPVEHLTATLPNSRLIRLNRDHPGVPSGIAKRAASLSGDVEALLRGFVETS